MPIDEKIDIARLAERMANFQSETFRRLDDIQTHTSGMGGRLNSIEIEMATLKGKASIMGIIWGSVSAVLVGLVGKHF